MGRLQLSCPGGWPGLCCKAHLARPARGCPASPERDLPEPLDQKMVTWEAVQKESYLSRLEQSRRESEAEVLRRTAHRCQGNPGDGAARGRRWLSGCLGAMAPALRMRWDTEAERRGVWRDRGPSTHLRTRTGLFWTLPAPCVGDRACVVVLPAPGSPNRSLPFA